jgi:hypothetical protein
MPKKGLFSARKGLVKPKLGIQTGKMDKELKTRIWNCLWVHYFESMNIDHRPNPGYGLPTEYLIEGSYLNRLWNLFFYWPLHSIPPYHPSAVETILKKYDEFEWYQVYDFIEFTAQAYPMPEVNNIFREECNNVFEEELGGYRFVAGEITDITNKEEIQAIEDAASIPLEPPRQHIQKAIELYSDRKNPDYPNTIKESISAVESLSQIISNTPQSLGDSLRVTGPKIGLPGILQDSLSKLYAMSSNQPGVRHGSKDGIEGNADDARFFLIVCSAWVNYIYAMARKKGALPK